MKKWLTVIVLLLSIMTLSGCNNDKDIKSSTSSRVSSKKKIGKSLKIAQQDTNALFDNDSHTKLLRGASSSDTIKLVEQEVKELKDSKEKNKLLTDIEHAKKLWVPLAKDAEKFGAYQPSKKTDEQKKLEAEEAAASSNKATTEAAVNSSKASSQAASKSAISLRKAQSDYKSEVIENIQRIHKRIDGVDGIIFEALNLFRRPGTGKKPLKKSLAKINLAIDECKNAHITSSELANDKVLITNINRFLELSIYELKSTKQFLENSLYGTDIITNSMTDEQNHNERLKLYETISK
ncbi:toxin Cry1Ac domain D-VI-related protein [Lapidilactobacillus bayanensis]|uniref:toxin Cry1Ac domain D-VI-related protein n=1 Tax=Lapidilactobacillus bayanensis TaxID=2485998 RepID=UPI000F7B3DCA|nr:toxin Cry1Ac domain D-VI-related protein [Lapidilactobacillus bayanensis]